MRTEPIVVDARFTTVPVTGVQRYGYELVNRLAERSGSRPVLGVIPPTRVLDLSDGTPLVPNLDTRFSGGAGHLWEQAVLPAISRRLRSAVLVGPCNWGPLAVSRQVPVFHDAAPLFHPELFEPGYVAWTRLALPRLVRRARRLIATCERVRDELVRSTGADADRIDIVPPGVGPPFTTIEPRPADAPRRCVFIGGHDVRKNLGFLDRIWPRVHVATGLELHVVARSWTSARRGVDGDRSPVSGVVVHTDIDDAALADLYAGSLCLLSPSLYEGYGLPLLEAMATGTPFLSSNTGAARELAIQPAQVLPLEPEAWIERIDEWSRGDLGPLREACAARARAQTWDISADVFADVIERSAAA
jgi:glycosyltransferase involved in cell wall biosynthesis